jgi:hypothetical protein
MNAISLARVITSSLVRVAQECNFGKHRHGWNKQDNANHYFNIHSSFKFNSVLFVLAFNAILTGIAHSKSIDCDDIETPSYVEIIDSSRFGFLKNDSRVKYSGSDGVYSSKKMIDFEKRKPDFCLHYTLKDDSILIDTFNICYKLKKYKETLSSVSVTGFGRSNTYNRKSISSVTSSFDRSDSSMKIENEFSISSKDFKQDLKIILIFDSNGVSSLSNITNTLNVSIIKYDCKHDKYKCKQSYDF